MTDEQFERLEQQIEELHLSILSGFSSLSALLIEAHKGKMDLEAESFSDSLALGASLVGQMRETFVDEDEDEDEDCGCCGNGCGHQDR